MIPLHFDTYRVGTQNFGLAVGHLNGSTHYNKCRMSQLILKLLSLVF